MARPFGITCSIHRVQIGADDIINYEQRINTDSRNEWHEDEAMDRRRDPTILKPPKAVNGDSNMFRGKQNRVNSRDYYLPRMFMDVSGTRCFAEFNKNKDQSDTSDNTPRSTTSNTTNPESTVSVHNLQYIRSATLLDSDFGFKNMRTDAISRFDGFRRQKAAMERELQKRAERHIAACQLQGTTLRGSRALESLHNLRETFSASSRRPLLVSNYNAYSPSSQENMMDIKRSNKMGPSRIYRQNTTFSRCRTGITTPITGIRGASVNPALI